MTWLQLEVQAPAEIATELAEQLHVFGALSITQSDAAGELTSAAAIEQHAVLEPPLGTSPLWETTLLAALFDLNLDVKSVRHLVAEAFINKGKPVPACDVSFVEEQDWRQSWQQFAVCRLFGKRLRRAEDKRPRRAEEKSLRRAGEKSPRRAGEKSPRRAGEDSLWRAEVKSLRRAEDKRLRPAGVKSLWLLPRDESLWFDPEGEEITIANHHTVLKLDPGLAFGTGGHATTALCLEWLASQNLAAAKVLDFGCGSGILAVAAALLGAEVVVALDHDPQALLATRENAAYNGLSADQVCVVDAETEFSPEQFDIVVANILANTIVDFAAVLKGRLLDGGSLVLSGILENQVDAVRGAYSDFEFEVLIDAPWACLIGQKI